MDLPTAANVRGLLAQFQGNGTVVSCYADTSAIDGFRPLWVTRFKTEAGAVKRLLAEAPQAGRNNNIDQDLSAIRSTLESPEARHDRQARGLAVFSDSRRGLLRTFALSLPVENRVVVDASPYLVPLLEVLFRNRTYLAVFTDSHRGRLYAASPAEAVVLAELSHEIPSRQHPLGERGGKQEMNTARHREELVGRYYKDLVQHVEKAWAERHFQGLILLGRHEVTEAVRKLLPPRLASRVVHEGSHAWAEDSGALRDEVVALVAKANRQAEEQFFKGIQGRLDEGYGIAAGAQQVIEAIQTGRLGARGHGCLVLGPDPLEVVGRCTGCRSLWPDVPANCPRCQAPCAEANLWEELLLLALRHDLAVYFAKPNGALTRRGGVVAVLPENKGK
jgi:hypothetical protein